jgi:uncharacterized protein (TIGR00255 family)
MTGYGRGEALLYDRRFIVEIKSVNHRYNDITIKIPRAMLMYEDKVKKLLTADIFRGKTDVYVSFESYSAEDVKVKVNEALADSYVQALTSLKERYSVRDEISLGLLARFPDLITVEKNTTSEGEHDEIWECLEAAASQALANFVAMRETEGEALKINILEKLDGIEAAIKRVEKRAPLVASDYRQRLLDRLAEIKELDVDESRIITEVAIFADKACIDEEITRMFSHISQMRSILEETTPVGRKLDFLIQEMNREVNTMGSKSNDLEITGIIVDTKSEIEKIREQIQNFE